MGNACTRKVLLWESDEKLHPVESGELSEIQVSLVMILNLGVLVLHSTDSRILNIIAASVCGAKSVSNVPDDGMGRSLSSEERPDPAVMGA